MSCNQRIKNGDKNIIGKNIRHLRQAKRIHQTDLARKVSDRGIPFSRDSLVKIEAGRQHISLDQLNGIRDILGCTYDDLLSEN